MNEQTYLFSWEEIDAMPPSTLKAKAIAVHGLLTDGGHHKQYCLEEIMKALEVDLEKLREALREEDYDWEDGIAP